MIHVKMIHVKGRLGVGGRSEPVSKLPTGIVGFDHIALGGLPVRRTTLVAGSTGSGKTLFGLEFLMKGILQFDEPGVFVTFEEIALRSPADHGLVRL